MRHTPCTFSPALALRRVFLPSSSSSSASAAAAITPQNAAPYRRLHLSPPQRLRGATIPFLPVRAAVALMPRRALATAPPPRKKERPRNEDIPYDWVRVVQSDGSLSPPRRKTAILRVVNRQTHFLEMVAKPRGEEEEEEEEEGEEGEEGEYEEDQREGDTSARDRPYHYNPFDDVGELPAAVCRIVDRAAAAAAEAAAKIAARRRAVNTKEMELSWAIAPHDLGHKSKRLRTFLEKGMQVEVLLARKKGGRVATAEEAAATLRAVREIVASVPGTRETKTMGKVGDTVRIVFEGPSEKERRRLRNEAEDRERQARERRERGEVDEEGQELEPGQEGSGLEQGSGLEGGQALPQEPQQQADKEP